MSEEVITIENAALPLETNCGHPPVLSATRTSIPFSRQGKVKKLHRVDDENIQTIFEDIKRRNEYKRNVKNRGKPFSEAFYDSQWKKYNELGDKLKRRINFEDFLKKNPTKEFRELEYRDGLNFGIDDVQSPTLKELCRFINSHRKYGDKWTYEAKVIDEQTYHQPKMFYYQMKMELKLNLNGRVSTLEVRNGGAGRNLIVLQNRCYFEALEFGLLKQFNYFDLVGDTTYQKRMDEESELGTWFWKGGMLLFLFSFFFGCFFAPFTFGLSLLMLTLIPFGWIMMGIGFYFLKARDWYNEKKAAYHREIGHTTVETAIKEVEMTARRKK